MNSHQNLLAIVGLAATSVSSTFAQDWTLTSAPPLDWRCIASSADGRRLAAAPNGGLIYLSTNSGTTWTPVSTPQRDWIALASSADGSKLAAAVQYGFGAGNGIYVSPDSGATWKLVFSPSYHFWSSLACSADGQRIAAVSTWSPWFTNGVYISTNFGTDWVLTSAQVENPKSVVSSADGSRLAVATWGAVHVSTNFGTTWTPTYPTNEVVSYLSVAASATGRTLIAASTCSPPSSRSLPGSIFISSDWGATWKPVGTLTNDLHSVSATCSADGVFITVFESSFSRGTRVLLSTDSGALWSATRLDSSTNMCSATSSADGSKLAAALGQFWPGQGIYVRQTAPVPQLEILRRGAGLKISWLVPSEDFALQESLDLSAWSEVAAAQALNYTNLKYEVNLTPPPGRMFYRLVPR